MASAPRSMQGVVPHTCTCAFDPTGASWNWDRMTLPVASDAARAWADRAHVVLDDNPDPNALAPQTIVVKLNDGRSFERHVVTPLGSPGNALSADAPRHQCQTAKQPAISAKAAESEKRIAEIRAGALEAVTAVAKDTAKELVSALGGKADAADGADPAALVGRYGEAVRHPAAPGFHHEGEAGPEQRGGDDQLERGRTIFQHICRHGLPSSSR